MNCEAVVSLSTSFKSLYRNLRTLNPCVNMKVGIQKEMTFFEK